MLETLFFGCAVFGGAVMVMQFLLTAMGFGAGEDADGADFSGSDVGDASAGDAGDVETHTGPAIEHHGTLGLIRMLSFRTIIAGATFFGLGGLAGGFAVGEFGLSPAIKAPLSVSVALVLGLSAIYIVHHLYSWMYSLRYDGSVSLSTLAGVKGTVYVKIPQHGATGGKVLVNHQERTMEYEAITQGEELKAGTPISVLRVISGTTVEVAKV